MKDINLIGYVGNKPTYKEGSGKKQSFAAFSLCCKGRRKDADDMWFNVVCFSKLADIVGSYVDKGKQVFVAGELSEIKEYEGKFTPSVEAATIQFFGNGNGKGKSKPRHEEPEEEAEEEEEAPKKSIKKSSRKEEVDEDGDDL